MSRNAQKGWTQITLDAWQLGAEAWLVVGLRAARLAGGGPAACSEARLMVSEKIESGVELGSALVSGELGMSPRDIFGNAVSHYLKGVRANRKRLARPSAKRDKG